MDNTKIDELRSLIKESKRIVFLTGAGISKASGIPDIRGSDGLLKRDANNLKYGATYEEIVSHVYFMLNTKKFFEYYFNEMIFNKAKPNNAHKAIARLNDKAIVITQNIDGLHSLAGSKNVIEIHGSTQRNYCLNCHSFYSLNDILKFGVPPRCPKCGGFIKPDVVLFNEPLNEDNLNQAVEAIMRADLLICIGTSLVVNPAASLPYYFNGKALVIINKDKTPLDSKARILINEDVNSFIDKVIE